MEGRKGWGNVTEQGHSSLPQSSRGDLWVLKSKDGPALVTDYENGTEKELQKMVEKGEISGVECLWITHYHDDHCRAGVVPFRKAFPTATVIADSHVAEVITAPSTWPPLPCLNPIRCKWTASRRMASHGSGMSSSSPRTIFRARSAVSRRAVGGKGRSADPVCRRLAYRGWD